MAETQFTPGPWFLAEGGICAANCPADGSNVICLEPEPLMAASLAKWSDNANLLVAAPDLLAAATDALAGWRYIRRYHGELYGVGWDRVDAPLQAAINKALGK